MFQRLLLAVDGSDAGAVGVSFACAVARQYAAPVHVVYVNQMLVGGRGTTVRSRDEAAELVEEAVAELQATGIEASGSVVRANCFGVAHRIVESAHLWSADAIVLGSHRHRRLPRLRSQGIRERVIQLAQLPVLTAPAPLQVARRLRPWSQQISHVLPA
jgi:nucleotide-binding universal stress UspA family protein